MAAVSNFDTKKLYNKLSKLYENGYDLLVNYKKLSKRFTDKKKNLSPSHKNLEIKKEKIKEELKEYLNSLQKLEKGEHQKEMKDKVTSLKFEVIAIDQRIKTEKNESKNYILYNEKLFLKSKKILRVRKIYLLKSINELKLLLKKQLKERFDNYIHSNFDTRVFGNDPDYQDYTGKHIIKFLKAGAISEKAAKKAKQINDLESLENISDRKAQMELQIELVKLGDIRKKYKEYEKLFINEIKKIISEEDDDMMKSRLFKVVNNKIVIKPTEFDEFLDSTTQEPIYQNKIDEYKLKVKKLENKHKKLVKKINLKKSITN